MTNLELLAVIESFVIVFAILAYFFGYIDVKLLDKE